MGFNTLIIEPKKQDELAEDLRYLNDYPILGSHST